MNSTPDQTVTRCLAMARHIGIVEVLSLLIAMGCGDQSTASSVGSVCAAPGDTHADGRPTALGQGTASGASVELLWEKSGRELCPADACTGEPLVVASTPHRDGGVLFLLALTDADNRFAIETGVPVALQHVHADGTLELLGTRQTGPMPAFPLQLAPDGRVVTRSEDGRGLLSIAPTLNAETEIQLLDGAHIVDVALGPDGALWVELIEATEGCADPEDLSGCTNPFFRNPSELDLEGARIELPERFVARLDEQGEPRWKAPVPERIHEEERIWWESELAVDRRGWLYRSQVFLDPHRTVVDAFDPEGEHRYSRELDGYGRIVSDDEGMTLVFAALDNVKVEEPEPESSVVGRPIEETGDGPVQLEDFEQALNPTPVEEISPDGPPAGARGFIVLAQVPGYHGCPGLVRLDDAGDMAWSWSGVFLAGHAADSTLVVQELDVEQTEFRVAQAPGHHDAQPVVRATHRLGADGRYDGAFELPATDVLLVDRNGVVYNGAIPISAYRLD